MIKTAPHFFKPFACLLSVRLRSFLARTSQQNLVTILIFAVAAMVLGYEPVKWLINTWREPSYDSKGFYIFLAVVALFVWSASSAQTRPENVRQKRTALALLAVTAIVRLLGQVLAINTIGALALVLDIFALGLLFGLSTRQRALSPGWLAVAFAFSLPLERIAQRTIGYALQSISADGACLMLGGLFDQLQCYGVRLVVEGVDVLVDLPCSGARSLLLLLLCFALVAAIVRPGCKQMLIGGTLTLAAGLLANMMRITVLAIGIARPQSLFSIDVMAQPWHDIIGLMALTLGVLPLLFWAIQVTKNRPAASIDERCRHFIPDRLRNDGWWLGQAPVPKKRAARIVPAVASLMAALVIVNLPRQAIDVARRSINIELPMHLAGMNAVPLALLDQEKSYFLKYGGSAQKASYGPHQLLVVRTSAPLRHLHAPDECLRGLGMKVQYLGISHDTVPSAIYRATTKAGEAYLIHVSFVSDDGFITTNISEAVWRWMQNPRSIWTAIQRITPEQVDSGARRQFDGAVIAAFDLAANPPKTASLQ